MRSRTRSTLATASTGIHRQPQISRQDDEDQQEAETEQPVERLFTSPA